MAPETLYDQAFYAKQCDGSLQSARAIVPILLSKFSFHSVGDVGCGVGTWLKAFQENGISDIAGYDGEYVDRSNLLIAATQFSPVDLCSNYSLPRTFDLAVSVEVAEHIPETCGDHLVQQLTTAAPLVLFSAAIPGQGGTNHINEQWQDYWRSKFRAFGYSPVDAIRPLVWGREDIETWYQQNIVLYCKDGHLPADGAIQFVPPNISLNIVHPEYYLSREPYFSRSLKLLPSLAVKAISRRIAKR